MHQLSETDLQLEDVQRLGRKDSLPEFTRYRDTGCNWHPKCLECPFVRCKYEEDTAGDAKRMFNSSRDSEILTLHSQDVHVSELAHMFGLSRRSIFRILARAKKVRRGT